MNGIPTFTAYGIVVEKVSLIADTANATELIPAGTVGRALMESFLALVNI